MSSVVLSNQPIEVERRRTELRVPMAASPVAARLESWRLAYLRRIVATALRAAGLDRSTALVCKLARGYFDLNTRGRRLAEQRIARAFGDSIPEPARAAIVRTMYEHVARFWIEALFINRRLRPSNWRRAVSLRSPTDPRALQSAYPRCVLATAYFGNPAVAAFVAGQIFRPVSVVVDLLEDPAARAWQEELYRLPNVRTIPIDRATERLPDALNNRGAVMLVIEHRRRRGAGVPAPFLGDRAVFQPTPGRLAAWFSVPVVPALCRRKPRIFEFEMWFGRPVSGDDPIAVTTDVLQQLDAEIRRRPEQYLWSIPADAPTAPDRRGIDY